MIDLGTIDNGDGIDAEPVQFTLTYTIDGEPRSDDFTAHGQVPYGVTLAFLAAGQLGLTDQAAAMLTFLEMAMPGEQWARLNALIVDPAAQIHAETLHKTASRLVIHYTTPRLDPTQPAKSGGGKKSAAGRKATSGGSSARARGKASTS